MRNIKNEAKPTSNRSSCNFDSAKHQTALLHLHPLSSSLQDCCSRESVLLILKMNCILKTHFRHFSLQFGKATDNAFAPSEPMPMLERLLFWMRFPEISLVVLNYSAFASSSPRLQANARLIRLWISSRWKYEWRRPLKITLSQLICNFHFAMHLPALL